MSFAQPRADGAESGGQPAGHCTAAGHSKEGKHMTVAAILKHKGHEVVSVAPTMDVMALARTLSARRIGAAVVRDAAGQLLGIVTERDVLNAVAAKGAAALAQSVAQLMTRALTTVAPTTTVAETMALMTSGRIRHLPVVEHGELVGIVSIGDVVKSRIAAQEGEVESLRAYVAGAA
jgi:CBS domain-containing protein